MTSTATPLHPTLTRLDRLAAHVRSDPSVLAVLGLGSAGLDHQRFDEHSDIDFFLIVADQEAKDTYLADPAWVLGFGGELVHSFVNDRNGRKALFADGLFLEYAVVTREQLKAMPLHGVRTVWQRPGVTLPDHRHPSRPALDSIEFHLNEALTNLFVGLHRELRGERLAASRLIQVHAVDRVLALLRLTGVTDADSADPFDPTRRVDRSGAAPAWSMMMPGIDDNRRAAAAILGWLTDHFEADRALVAAVEGLLATDMSTDAGPRR